MRKIQRSFAVEYRSSRRRPEKKPSSIWGDVDLKAIAQDVQEEATSPGKANATTCGPDDGSPSAGLMQSVSSLTPTLAQNTTAEATGETIMADEDQMPAIADEKAVDTVPEVAQTRRKPRMKRTTQEGTSGEANEQAIVKKRRGRKPKDEATETPKRRTARNQSKVIEKPSDVPASATDEMADLLQLEQENQRLRKLLAEKLRAENAELRRRLNLN